MAERGEILPESWTVTQIRARWDELRLGRAERGEGLQAKLEVLYQKARKKADLVEFMKAQGCQKTDGTIATLVSRMEKLMHEEFEPTGDELVGFGKHGDLTMRQVVENHSGYIERCKTTVWEDTDHHWRMNRLVAYATRHQHATAVRASQSMMKMGPGPPVASSSDGYSMVSAAESTPAVTQSLLADVEAMKSQMGGMQAQYAQLMVKHEDLQRENAELRKENAELTTTTARSKNRKEM